MQPRHNQHQPSAEIWNLNLDTYFMAPKKGYFSCFQKNFIHQSITELNSANISEQSVLHASPCPCIWGCLLFQYLLMQLLNGFWLSPSPELTLFDDDFSNSLHSYAQPQGKPGTSESLSLIRGENLGGVKPDCSLKPEMTKLCASEPKGEFEYV